MAKQAGPFKITGCIDNVCFYKMGGEYYARRKSSLDRDRVNTDPAFRLTRYYSNVMARASKLASLIRRCIPGWEKNKDLYRLLLTECIPLIKQGWEEGEIRNYLLNNFITCEQVKTPVKKQNQQEKDTTHPVKDVFAEALLHRLFANAPAMNELLLMKEVGDFPP